VFEKEPPADWRLVRLRQVLATPHIAASTAEAQELVGTETAAAVRDYLLTGAITNAVNFPTLRGPESAKLEPFTRLAERMGALLTQISEGPIHGISIRYYGAMLAGGAPLIARAAIAGVLRPILSTGVSVVNARDVAAARGIEIVESQSSRARTYANVLSIKLQTRDGERWAEGTVSEPGSPRLVAVDGVEIEAPLDGSLLVIRNEDQPGVIGDVGTILGRHQINIASFTLGRTAGGAVGVVNVDAADGALERAVSELRALPALRQVCSVRL
jgi:D-3-phosphoglycerate dehydrogenase / 2-oxoglutarate reductase